MVQVTAAGEICLASVLVLGSAYNQQLAKRLRPVDSCTISPASLPAAHCAVL